MSKYKKIIVAGPLVVEAVYPAPSPRDSNAVRAGKKRLSSEAQHRMNLQYCYQKLELEVAANFGVKDLYATFTYDDDHLPKTRKAAIARIQYFWRKLREARGVRGQEARYIYVTESKHGDGRLHHHVLLNSTGEDYALIQQLWRYGRVEYRQIRVDKEKNFETLARYLCKEQRETVGQRLWSTSRNLHKPEVETFRVPDDTSILPPPNAAIVFEDTGDRTTSYGHYRYIKFLAYGWRQQPKPKVKRTRKRKK